MRIPALLCTLVLLGACDRNVEPFVEGEKSRAPDLSSIFPEGAEEVSGRALVGDAPDPKSQALGVRATLPPSRNAAVGGGSAASGASAGSAEAIHGTIEISAALAAQAPSSATLFVIARGEQAGGPPLAVRRFVSPVLPLAFELGPEHVMIQGMSFEGNIRLTARLDGDGNAMTRDPGDLAGEAAELVQPGARGVRIVLE
jgi:hypothetical protein